jgi:hypothetical protein
MSQVLEVGSWDKLPHYAVVGTPVNFYVWVCTEKPPYGDVDQGASEWITGLEAFTAHAKLRQMAAKGRREEFITLVKELHKSNRKRI